MEGLWMVSSPSSPDYSRPSPPRSPKRSRSKSKNQAMPMPKDSWSDDGGWETGWRDGWEDWEEWDTCGGEEKGLRDRGWRDEK